MTRTIRTLRGCLFHAFLIAASAAAGLCGSATAQNTPEFDAWWARLTAGGHQGPSIDGVKIAYRVEFVLVPPEPELAEMRKRVEGHPEHPDRPLLDTYERRRARTTPQGLDYSLWRFGSRWRWNSKPLDPGAQYSDIVWGDGVTWSLTPGTLAVISHENVGRSPYRYDTLSSSFVFDSLLFTTGGVTFAVARGLQLEPRLDAAGKWTVEGRLAQQDGGSYEFNARGGWNVGENWGTVDHVRSSVVRADGQRVGSTVSSFDWQLVPALRLGVAGRVLYARLDGVPEKRFTLSEVGTFSEKEMAELSRPPAMDGSDPVRGRVTFRSVVDLRGDTPVLSGDVDDSPGVRESLEPMRARAASESRLRTIGWVLAAMIVVTLTLLRVRRVLGNRLRRVS